MITKPYNHIINLGAEVLVEFKSGAEGSSSKRWGGCGVDYIESENYAITTGMKPWVVEIRIDKGKLNIPFHIRYLTKSLKKLSMQIIGCLKMERRLHGIVTMICTLTLALEQFCHQDTSSPLLRASVIPLTKTFDSKRSLL